LAVQRAFHRRFVLLQMLLWSGRDNENSCPPIFPCVRGLAAYPALSVTLTALFWHEQRSVALVAAAGATAALLLSIALAWVLGKRIARAVSGLASVARGLATAQPAPPIPTGNVAEINETANAFGETRKQLQARERQLRESEEKFRTLTTHAPVGIFLSDLKGDYYFVNRNWCTVSRMTVEQAKGRGWQ
jgi:PAS domain-containing protein